MIEAEQLYRRALSIKERNDGPNHPELAPTLNNLATLLKQQGHNVEAATICQRALAILEHTGRAGPPDLADLSGELHGDP